MDYAETKSRTGEWFSISIEDALAARKTKPGTLFRCRECGGQVYPHREAVGYQAARFEHKHAHAGCSLIEATFGGVSYDHPVQI